MKKWIYHDDHEARVIETEENWDYASEGWRDSFRKPGEAETPLSLPPETPVALDDPIKTEGIDALLVEAERLNIKVDGRWGKDRLKQEIAAHGDNS